MKYRLTTKAHSEIYLSATWYEAKREGLGAEFILEIEYCISKICRNPKLHSVRYRVLDVEFRRFQMRAFPHGIIYTIEENEIIIYAVFHPSRDEDILYTRLRK